MEFDLLTKKAIDYCLRDNIPFVVYALPGDSEFRFFASLPDTEQCSPAFSDDSSDCFFINFFDNDEPYTAGVRFEMTAAELVESIGASDRVTYARAEIQPRVPATLRVSYTDAFSSIIPRLKADGGKVVLSRHRSILTFKFPTEIAQEYFSMTDKTFRYLCFTPETGIWLGSTPELLLESDGSRRQIRTMALAGTRPADDMEPWDDKNIREHLFVTDFIVETLRSEGLEVASGQTEELRFLNIKHLCTPIAARGVRYVRRLLAELSPTPAVAGYPREQALDEINLHETHRRFCYGGYVGVRIDGDYHAYVNLRCCFMAPAIYREELFGWLCNLYVGGGIVAGSVEKSEWAETEAKSSSLANILLSGHPAGIEGPELKPDNVELLDFAPFDFAAQPAEEA
ncbi:MAG: chorismate-binding protein [Staphylococcus sp.]|nr:chorismate-binding protein [Staphylococcus sp.]